MPAIIAGIVFNVWMGRYDNFIGALFIFVAMFICWLCGWIGGGDMKLAPGLTLFLGARPVLYGIVLAIAVFALWHAFKTWRSTKYVMAFFMALLGKLPGNTVPLAVLMGPMAVALRLLGLH